MTLLSRTPGCQARISVALIWVTCRARQKYLFSIIEPNFACFGKKDFQQLLLIKYIAKTYFPHIQILDVDVVRENNIALSSRLNRLGKESLNKYANIYNILVSMRKGLREGEKFYKLKEHYIKKIESLEISVEYLDHRKNDTLEPAGELLEESSNYVDGGDVGDAAQFTAGIGLDIELAERLSVDGDVRFYHNLFADVGPTANNLELPNYQLMDLGLSYKMLLDSGSLDIRLNLNNVFDKIYIGELRTAVVAGDEDATGILYNGIDTGNEGFFGLGRTWNLSLRYNF